MIPTKEGGIGKIMDELCITQRVDEKGITYCPAAVINGHISRMGEDFLRYVNKAETCLEVNLGASNGAEYWQLHDNRRQNGVFKSELASSKSRFYIKKISWVNCRNFTLQYRPCCLGRNHEIIHEHSVLVVCFAPEGLESLQLKLSRLGADPGNSTGCCAGGT